MTLDGGVNNHKLFEFQLIEIFYRYHSGGLEVKLETSIVGTFFVARVMCPDGHVLHWQSQPMVRGMAAGNLLLFAAILLCGLTFTGFASLANDNVQQNVVLWPTKGLCLSCCPYYLCKTTRGRY